VIEVSSAAAVAWQFADRDPEKRVKIALRIIAFSFFALALYVVIDSIRALFGLGEAQHSTIGIVLAAVSLAIMPALSAAQRRAGRELGATSRRCCWWGCCSTACSGGSWADPLAALVIAGIAVREGIEAWRGESCCPAPGATVAAAPGAGRDCDCCD
jgi:hypothetical protein